MPTALGWMTQGLLNRWTSQLDLSCTIGGLERVVSVHNSTHYANQYERYESKNRFVNPFETNGNIFIDIKFSKKYMTDKRPLEIF